MKLISKIVLVSMISFIFLAVFLPRSFLLACNKLLTYELFEINMNRKVHWNEPSYELEAWNKIYENVSAIPDYWNATVPSWMVGRSIPQVAAIFLGRIYNRNPKYPLCFIVVPELTSQYLNISFTELGLVVWDYVPASIWR